MIHKIYNDKNLSYDDKLVGEIFKTNNFGDIKVIAKLKTKNRKKRHHSRYVVKFLNTGYMTDYEKYVIVNGKLKDPYIPTLYGIGYIGSINKRHIDDTKLYEKLYSVWKNMIARCYYENHSKFSCYGAKGIYVSKRWHNFTNFYNDAQQLPRFNRDLVVQSKLQLDKDLLCNDTKKYSYKTCTWLTRKENNDLVDRSNNPLRKPIVVYHPNGNITIENSMRKCIKKYHIDDRTIHNCIKNDCKSAKGYRFKYYKK